VAHDVFISYSSKDKVIADAVCARLEGRGIRCWIAPRDVQPGLPYGEEIIDAIHGSKVMVLVFSSNANASPHIPKEIERAVSHGVSILPLRVEAVAPGKSLDYFISSVHWLDAITPPLESHLESLANTILTLLLNDQPRPPIAIAQPTPPPQPLVPPASPKKRQTGLFVGIASTVVLLASAAADFLLIPNKVEQASYSATTYETPQSNTPPAKSPAGTRDPISGCWQWFNNVPVTINSDGRLVAGPFTARWQRAGGRAYHFTWLEAVDAVTLSSDGNSLRGGNQYGFPTSATRVSPGTGISGAWRLANGGIVLINPGGTFNAGPFNGRWSTTGGNRFNLTWPKPVDSVTLSPDSQHLSGHNQYGIVISGAKTSAACGG
jgi:hypothetical protein